MDTKWGDWKEHIEAQVDDYWSPYFHWATEGSGGIKIVKPDMDTEAAPDFFALKRAFFDWEFSEPPDEGFDVKRSEMLVPTYAVNEEYKPIIANDTAVNTAAVTTPNEADTPLEAGTIIAGVIDIGIPLGHNRWRFKNGKTRLLAAWQMMAPWDLKSQSYLPFGAEFSQSEINDLLKHHSGGAQNGWLNEHDFNVDTGLVSLVHRQAQRGAAGHSSHGAHVLDVVAGMDPNEEEAFQKRVRIIAINAPTSAVFKAAGTHLDAYMFYAVQRIVDIADKVWAQNNPDFPDNQTEAVRGYPIVINMSFGKQAGSKDALDEFPAKLARFVEKRASEGKSMVRFVMPSGNDNQSRCNAMLEPQKGAVEKLNWRILPQDHSANYVEIWGDNAAQTPVNISLRAPHAKARFLDAPNPDFKHQYRDLHKDDVLVARMYFSRVALLPENSGAGDEADNRIHEKFRYVLCTAPTYAADRTQPAAPSGLWEIAVKNLSDKCFQCVFSVQTDQALSASDGTNLRSYFDDAGYELFGENGAFLESYSFPPGRNNSVENLDIRAQTPVRRHGTMNASAAHGVVARVGGYRVSDGRPAPYSATGRGRANGKDDGTVLGSTLSNGRKGAPTASFPTEDSPAHFGILAAGGGNGSVAAMRGTSFASAQGARALIQQLLKSTSKRTANEMLYSQAKADERASTHATKHSDELIDVLGAGRINRPDTPKVARF